MQCFIKTDRVLRVSTDFLNEIFHFWTNCAEAYWDLTDI